MPRDSSGTYTRTDGVVSGNDIMQQQRDTIGNVNAPRHDAHDNDMASAITDSIAKTGVTTPTANLPMGGFRHTNVDDAAVRNNYASLAQLQDGKEIYAIATGTGDAIVVNYNPAITAIEDGQQFRVRAPGSNTVVNPTFQVGATTARTIVKAGGAPLAIKDYLLSSELILRYRQQATPVYELLNPELPSTLSAVPIPVGEGGTGAVDVPGAQTNLEIPIPGPVAVKTFTASGTWTKPADIKRVVVEVCGGGGGGNEGTTTLAGGGGGGGGYSRKVIDVTAIASETVTVGTGGAGGTTSGAAGGTSSFGTHLSANGGAGSSGSGAGGGTAANGNVNVTGGFGGSGGGNTGGIGGGSYFSGTGGRGNRGASNGQAAQTGQYGCGGGGAGPTGTTGGDGAGGIVIVTEYGR